MEMEIERKNWGENGRGGRGAWCGWIVDRWIGFGSNGEEEDREKKRALGTVWYNID